MAQVSVSLALGGAGLFLKTLASLLDVDVGFNPGSVLLSRITSTLSGYELDQSAGLYDRITQSYG